MDGYRIDRIMVASRQYDKLGRVITQSTEYAINDRGALEKVGMTEVEIRPNILRFSKVQDPNNWDVE